MVDRRPAGGGPAGAAQQGSGEELPRLLGGGPAEDAQSSSERAGPGTEAGTITGIFSVLVDGDDHNEPVADAVRGILDGHIVLSRDLAARNHYPAIDVLPSISRTMPDVTDVAHRLKAGVVRQWLAALRDSEDLVSVGAYVAGLGGNVVEADQHSDPAAGLFLQRVEFDVVQGQKGPAAENVTKIA